MDKSCWTCKFNGRDELDDPCGNCALFWTSGTADNWQPRPTRDELEAQLTDLRRECEQYKAEREVAIARETLALYARDRQIVKVAELERELAEAKERCDFFVAANHRWQDRYDEDIAAKQAVIDEQRVELEHPANINIDLTREINKMQRQLNIKDAAIMVRDAIVEEQRKEIAELKNQNDLLSTIRQSQGEMIGKLHRERNEARRWARKLYKKVQDMESQWVTLKQIADWSRTWWK